MRFIDVKLSLKEKLILLLFNLMPERVINRPLVEPRPLDKPRPLVESRPLDNKSVEKYNSIQTKEEVLNFFDGIDEGKSNF